MKLCDDPLRDLIDSILAMAAAKSFDLAVGKVTASSSSEAGQVIQGHQRLSSQSLSCCFHLSRYDAAKS